MALFDCKDVTFRYAGTREANPTLSGVCLSIPHGCIFGIIGPNGSGKSTFLKCLYRSLNPTSGDIVFMDDALSSYSTKRLAKRMAVVVQTESASIPLTIREYVRLGRAVYRNVFEGFTAKDESIVDEALVELGIEEIQNRPITGISGGEYQRTMLARALAQQTDVLLLDEPTNHLDVFQQHKILQTVRKKNLSAVVVLHDLNLAARYCDYLAVLDDGAVVDTGTPDEILRADLIEKVYRMSAKRFVVDDVLQLVMLPLES